MISTHEYIAKPTRRRLPRDRFQATAQPKPLRIVDEAALERARSRGFCEWPTGPHFGRIDPAHVKTRGSGGADTDDNLVSLCRMHHSIQEDMGERGKVILRAIIRARSGQ